MDLYQELVDLEPEDGVFTIPLDAEEEVATKAIVIPIKVKGGAGSGNWGHAGRPGLVGGSTSTGAGVGGGKYAISNNPSDVSKEDLKDWEFKPSPRYQRAMSALHAIKELNATPIIVRDGGEVVALAAIDAIDPDKDYVEPGWLASKRSGSGYGTTCMVEICKIASRHGKGLRFTSSDTAVPFYDKLGMHRTNKVPWDCTYELSAEEVNGFISRVSGS